MEKSTNEYGLYDESVRSPKIEERQLTSEDLEDQFASGAFLLTREEAITQGFINPHDEQDTRALDVRS